MAPVFKTYGRGCPVDRIGEKQSTEEHNFSQQKQPHSDHSCFLLLFHGGEMVRQPGDVMYLFSQLKISSWLWKVVGLRKFRLFRYFSQFRNLSSFYLRSLQFVFLSRTLDLMDMLVFISLVCDHRRICEILGWRR